MKFHRAPSCSIIKIANSGSNFDVPSLYHDDSREREAIYFIFISLSIARPVLCLNRKALVSACALLKTSDTNNSLQGKRKANGLPASCWNDRCVQSLFAF